MPDAVTLPPFPVDDFTLDQIDHALNGAYDVDEDGCVPPMSEPSYTARDGACLFRPSQPPWPSQMCARCGEWRDAHATTHVHFEDDPDTCTESCGPWTVTGG